MIGPIIPPSIPMVLYALVSDASIGYLFLGGVVPGLLMALAQMVIVAIDRAPQEFPGRGADAAARAAAASPGARFPALMMPVVLLGGIYGGVTTPTEAAAVAAAYALADLGRALPQRHAARDFYRVARSTARARPPRSAC